ncbi:hypothetical protein PQI23_06770 [Leucobacter sp. USCH14]|uniref:hypothetical protein n=1 Tax=Leucobacter sp. USCH14 TaxID=3024838 RepID=UPI0030966585
MSSSEPQQPMQSPQSQQQPQYAQPQYPQQQYSQPQYAQPGAYHQPQVVEQPTRGASGSLNVPGILALAVLLLTTFIPLLTPVLYRAVSTTGSFSALSAVIAGANLLLLLVAGALAVVGLVVRRFTRWRWAAIGAAVAVAIGLVSHLFSWIGGLLLSTGIY